MENILILGDGNFSFSLAFAKVCAASDKLQVSSEASFSKGPQPQIASDRKNDLVSQACKIYATSYDNESVIQQNENSLKNVLTLKSLNNACVFHGIDATKIDTYFNIKFSKIIFNFPHVGGKSKISACRKLLADFFQSAASSIDDNGKVYVSLCKGQGGTPCDLGRKGYGNSWQIVTQASKAGFVLVAVKPFEIDSITAYTNAGYRGQLEKGFHQERALTHIFVKKDPIELPLPVNSMEFSDSQSLTKTAEEHFKKQLGTKNVYADTKHPLSKLTSILKDKLGILLTPACHNHERRSVESERLESKDLLFCEQRIQDFKLIQEQRELIFSSNNAWNARESIHHAFERTRVPFHFTETFISPAVEISPSSYPIYNELVLAVPESKFGSVNILAQTISDIIESLTGSVVRTSMRSAAVDKDLESTSQVSYDPSLVLNFLSDLDMKIWLKFLPEVTISAEESLDFGVKTSNLGSPIEKVLKYRNVEFNKYALTQRERRYLNRSQKFSYTHCLEDETSMSIFIDGLFVAKCGRLQAQESSDNTTNASSVWVVIFRIDQLCMMLLRVEDIRLFWSADKAYLTELARQLEDGCFGDDRPKTSIIYPLCFRHDLCFWLADFASEKTLLTAIRYVAKGMVHSVRLLRILRHEETDTISYCYRIIYSRCDGPLSHKETVDLQNALRLVLIRLNVELR